MRPAGEPPQLPLDPLEFPELARRLAARGGDALGRELAALLAAGRVARAHRHRVRVFAQLRHVVSGAGEIVQVRDVSASGILLAVPRTFPADVTAAWEIGVRATYDDGGKLMNLPAELVRVASRDADFVVVAFRFTEITREQGNCLAQLRSRFTA